MSLKAALARRSNLIPHTNAFRLFHGPGEGQGVFQDVAIDVFGQYGWVTFWEGRHLAADFLKVSAEIADFLKNSMVLKGAVSILRPEKGIPSEPQAFLGQFPEEPFAVNEDGIQYWIRFKGERHPGLFLDHRDLRLWLRSNVQGARVLNLFSYTGSLSIASAMGGADHVKSVDLSREYTEWAKENASLNGLTVFGKDSTPRPQTDFIYGDVFEWLPKLKKKSERFDVIILDPPSFSHGKSGVFSTAQDSERLHALALEVLSPRGRIVSSINSSQISSEKFKSMVESVIHSKGRQSDVLKKLEQPDSFPSNPRFPETAYLKGWIWSTHS